MDSCRVSRATTSALHSSPDDFRPKFWEVDWEHVMHVMGSVVVSSDVLPETPSANQPSEWDLVSVSHGGMPSVQQDNQDVTGMDTDPVSSVTEESHMIKIESRNFRIISFCKGSNCLVNIGLESAEPMDSADLEEVCSLLSALNLESMDRDLVPAVTKERHVIKILRWNFRIVKFTSNGLFNVELESLETMDSEEWELFVNWLHLRYPWTKGQLHNVKAVGLGPLDQFTANGSDSRPCLPFDEGSSAAIMPMHRRTYSQDFTESDDCDESFRIRMRFANEKTFRMKRLRKFNFLSLQHQFFDLWQSYSTVPQCPRIDSVSTRKDRAASSIHYVQQSQQTSQRAPETSAAVEQVLGLGQSDGQWTIMTSKLKGGIEHYFHLANEAVDRSKLKNMKTEARHASSLLKKNCEKANSLIKDISYKIERMEGNELQVSATKEGRQLIFALKTVKTKVKELQALVKKTEAISKNLDTFVHDLWKRDNSVNNILQACASSIRAFADIFLEAQRITFYGEIY